MKENRDKLLTICDKQIAPAVGDGKVKHLLALAGRNLIKSFYHSRATLLRGSPKSIPTALHFGEHPKTQPLNLK